mgnify:CR=1 FL=1
MSNLKKTAPAILYIHFLTWVITSNTGIATRRSCNST